MRFYLLFFPLVLLVSLPNEGRSEEFFMDRSEEPFMGLTEEDDKLRLNQESFHSKIGDKRDFQKLSEMLAKHPELVDCLNPGPRGFRGTTALHVSAGSGYLSTLYLLLGHDADIEARDFQGRTPLHYAALSGEEDAFALLLKHGANIDARDHDGLDYKALRRVNRLIHAPWDLDLDEEILRQMAREGNGLIDTPGNFGNTPLAVAINIGRMVAVRVFLEQGANPNRENCYQGDTPLHHAARKYDQPEMLELLLDYGAKLNTQNYQGETPLHAAVRGQMLFCMVGENRARISLQKNEMVKSLLRHGANPHLKNDEGQTPAEFATYRGEKLIAETLLKAIAKQGIEREHSRIP